MSDWVRQHAPDHTSGDQSVHRDAKIEQLLLRGLDLYFDARYEAAIYVWSRALFLDRGQARARAYIERARSALAERQRESEELTHTGIAAFKRGDVTAARNLLLSAIERGGSHDDVQVLLERLSRLDVAGGGQAVRRRSPRTRPMPHTGPGSIDPVRGRVRRLLPLIVVIGAAAAALYAMASWNRLEPLLVLPRLNPTRQAIGAAPPVPRPSASEMALTRAQVLHLEGRFDDALRMLDRVRSGSAFGSDADALRATIQRALLATVRQQAPNTAEPR